MTNEPLLAVLLYIIKQRSSDYKHTYLGVPLQSYTAVFYIHSNAKTTKQELYVRELCKSNNKPELGLNCGLRICAFAFACNLLKMQIIISKSVQMDGIVMMLYAADQNTARPHTVDSWQFVNHGLVLKCGLSRTQTFSCLHPDPQDVRMYLLAADLVSEMCWLCRCRILVRLMQPQMSTAPSVYHAPEACRWEASLMCIMFSSLWCCPLPSLVCFIF